MTKRGKIQKTAPEKPTHCQVSGCGGALRPDGYCERGGGYPFYMEAQPYVCENCARRLHWNGNCVGTKGGCWNKYNREGPGYYHKEINGHWVPTSEKSVMFTKKENVERTQRLQEELADLGKIPF